MTLTEIIEAINKIANKFETVEYTLKVIDDNSTFYSGDDKKFAKRDLTDALKIIKWTLEDLVKVL